MAFCCESAAGRGLNRRPADICSRAGSWSGQSDRRVSELTSGVGDSSTTWAMRRAVDGPAPALPGLQSVATQSRCSSSWLCLRGRHLVAECAWSPCDQEANESRLCFYHRKRGLGLIDGGASREAGERLSG